jgi:hypothetical protein
MQGDAGAQADEDPDEQVAGQQADPDSQQQRADHHLGLRLADVPPR